MSLENDTVFIFRELSNDTFHGKMIKNMDLVSHMSFRVKDDELILEQIETIQSYRGNGYANKFLHFIKDKRWLGKFDGLDEPQLDRVRIITGKLLKDKDMIKRIMFYLKNGFEIYRDSDGLLNFKYSYID